MSHRSLDVDPIAVRRDKYASISSNLTNEAIWEALALLHAQGIDIGTKAETVLDQRDAIKQELPK